MVSFQIHAEPRLALPENWKSASIRSNIQEQGRVESIVPSSSGQLERTKGSNTSTGKEEACQYGCSDGLKFIASPRQICEVETVVETGFEYSVMKEPQKKVIS